MSGLTKEREAEIRQRGPYLERLSRDDLDAALSWEEDARSELLAEVDRLRVEISRQIDALNRVEMENEQLRNHGGKLVDLLEAANLRASDAERERDALANKVTVCPSCGDSYVDGSAADALTSVRAERDAHKEQLALLKDRVCQLTAEVDGAKAKIAAYEGYCIEASGGCSCPLCVQLRESLAKIDAAKESR